MHNPACIISNMTEKRNKLCFNLKTIKCIKWLRTPLSMNNVYYIFLPTSLYQYTLKSFYGAKQGGM